MNEKVIFAAVRSSSGNLDSGTITYDSLTTNIGNGMNAATGIFTAPTSGLYMFTFSGVTAYENTAAVTIDVYKSLSHIFVIDDEEDKTSGANERNIGYSWIFDLSTGDTVYLSIADGGLHTDSGHDNAYFTGHLLHAT